MNILPSRADSGRYFLLRTVFISVILLIYFFTDIPAQSLISQGNKLIFTADDIIRNPENGIRQNILVPGSAAGKYRITQELLDEIHRLNTGGKPRVGAELLKRLDVPGNNGKPTKLSDADRALGEYRQYLAVESDFYMAQYADVYQKAEILLKNRIAQVHGQKLAEMYALSLYKIQKPVRISPDNAFAYLRDMTGDRLNQTAVYFALSLFAESDFEKVHAFLSMTVRPMSEELIKNTAQRLNANTGPDFYDRIYDAPADENLQALLLSRSSDLQTARSKDAYYENLFRQYEEKVTLRYARTAVDNAAARRLVAKNFNPLKIGVLLPFSYKNYAGYVSEVVRGLTIALQETSEPYELIFEDSTVNPDITERKILKLITEDKVSVIIGPLTKTTSQRAALIADRYEVPVISLSQTAGVGKDHPYMFRIYDNPDYRTKAIISYATDYLRLCNLNVVFNPSRPNYNRLSVTGENLTAVGCTIGEMYTADSNKRDFQDIFGDMTGRRFFQNENKNAVYGNASVNADGIILMVRPVQFLGMMSYFKTYGLTNQYLIMDGWFPEIVQSDSMRDKMFFAESLLVQEDADMNRFTDMHRQILGFSKEYNASLYAYYSYHILKMLIKVLAKDANSHQKLAVLLRDKNYIRTAMPGFTYNGEGEINRMVNIYKIGEFNKPEAIF